MSCAETWIWLRRQSAINIRHGWSSKAEETKIVITGGLEPEITVKGVFSLRKKEMDSIIRKAVNVLNIYLHAYVQDHMEYEAARNGGREA